MSIRRLGAAATFLLISACASEEEGSGVVNRFFGGTSEGTSVSSRGGGWSDLLPTEGRRDHVMPGNGRVVADRAMPVQRRTSLNGEDGVQLNLVNAPIPEAAQIVLGETLGLNYVVDPQIQGTITLQTSTPVPEAALVDVFETALAANNYAIVETAGVYRIVDRADAGAGTPPVSLPFAAPQAPGTRVVVVPLQFISAEEMRNILAPISPDGAVLRFDAERNYISLIGSSTEIEAMLDAISVFDVDWMEGKTVGLFALETSSASQIARELQEIFRSDGGSSGIVRFIPNEQLDSILVITSQPSYLARAREWISKLDRVAQSNEPRLFVYQVQNRSADELASVVRSVLGSEGLGDERTVAPDLGEVEVRSGEAEAPGLSGLTPASEPLDGSSSIAADLENNAILVNATPNDYAHIERILRRLDTLPSQVFLEALIVEVALNDDLRFGVRWFLQHGDSSLRLSDLSNGATGPDFPGFAWNVMSNDMEFTLNALSSVTDIEVISSPTLMALNNQEAVLQIGDQVPIVTRQASSVEDTDTTVVNSVDLRDTGIILNVIPRVNSTGGVLLDIEQEASRVVQTTTSGIDSPTIQQRRIRTRAALADGESLILGGLIQNSRTRNRQGVPVLSSIPIVGNAFGNKTNLVGRTELLIFVRPRIVGDRHAARMVSEEFRRQLNRPDNSNWQSRTRDTLQRMR